MKAIKTLITVLTLCGGLALLAGCSDDESPTAPGSEAAPMVELTWEASSLRVYQDCDASAARAEGDFHISFKLSDVTDGDEVVLDEMSNVIVKANSNSSIGTDDLNIALKTEVPLKNGSRVLLRMSIYELDPDGPQVSIGQGYYYTYSSVSNRWESEDDEGGVTFGQSDSQMLILEDNQGDPCHVRLFGRFSQGLTMK